MFREWQKHYWGSGSRCPECGGQLRSMHLFPTLTLTRREPAGLWVCADCPFPFRLQRRDFEAWQARRNT